MFLADLNNLKPEKNLEYKRVITSLENFVMIMWEDDATIIPRVSINLSCVWMTQLLFQW